mmetsp:Transcript_6631/g.9636  ORF Transcript_6631/g.9636 Transcript_6631/m.9636 type:complete len:392 (-) Transcript_6631:760-1935(-)
MSDLKTVVCDNGTGFVKCGFAGDNFPTHMFPAMVGKPVLRTEEGISNVQVKDIMCGEECAALRWALEVSYPVSDGQIRKWDDMHHLWKYTFEDKLKIDPKECQILLTEPPLNPVKNREKMLEAMFETYEFKKSTIQMQAVLSLYAQGRMTGLVADSGDGVTHVIPVFEGYQMPESVKRMNIAGRSVTQRLIKLLLQRGYAFNRTADFDTVRRIKEAHCYVGYDMETEMNLATNTTVLMREYTLPDGRVIKLGRERFLAPELLFNPGLEDHEYGGFHDLIFSSINNCAMDIRKELYSNIILSGGTTMYPGIPSRLEKEITELYRTKIVNGDNALVKKFSKWFKIIAPPQRKHMVFIGGAVFADIIKDNPQAWITKEEYDELGAKQVIKKHFR